MKIQTRRLCLLFLILITKIASNVLAQKATNQNASNQNASNQNASNQNASNQNVPDKDTRPPKTNLVSVSGTIVDSALAPIEFAQILLFHKEGSPTDSLELDQLLQGKGMDKVMASDFSDHKGQFNVQLDPGDYLLLITQLGKKLYATQLRLYQNQDLGLIQVTNIHQLNEIVVLADPTKRIERKSDRLVFNLSHAISLGGGSALDALRITPRIRMANDQISMVGKSAISVMIDEKLLVLTGQELVEQLKAIKADDIESIEVIANPSAKYMAEGNSGLINIVTKKQAASSYNVSMRLAHQQATYATESMGLSLGLQRKKLTLSSTFSASRGANRPILDNYVYYSDLVWREKTHRKDSSLNISFRNVAEYRISPKLSMGLQLGLIKILPTQIDRISSNIQSNTSSIEDSVLTTDALTRKDKLSKTLNYHLTYNPSLKTAISLDMDILSYQNLSTNSYAKYTYIDQRLVDGSYSAAENKGNQTIDNIAFNADIKSDFTRFDINYGGRVSFVRTGNRVDYYNLTEMNQTGQDPDAPLQPTESNRFEFSEKTQALYLTIHRKFNDAWDVSGGLRLENTQTIGFSPVTNQTNKRSYSKLFPTASINYAHTDHIVSLNLGRRIGRPSFNYLNPFRWVYSPYSYSEGNPFLQPSFTYNLEVEHTYDDFVTTTLYFSKLENGFEPVTLINDSTNQKQTIPQNFLVNRELGLDQYISLEPFAWWTSTVSLSVYYSSSRSRIVQTLPYLKGWNGEFSVSNDLTVNKSKTVYLNVSYNYTTKGVDNLDRNSAFSQLDASVKLFLFKKKLQLSLYANDILKTNRPRYSTRSNGLVNINRNYYDSRYLRVSLSYSCGQKLTTVKERNKNTEEVDRIPNK